MANKNLTLKKDKLLLVEGRDAWNFFIWALAAYKIEGIQVEDFGGITELAKFLKVLSLVDGYEKVQTIIIARDAETDYKSAITSVYASMRQVNLAVPEKIFEFTQGSPKTAIMIFPGFDNEGNIENGALEHLCLKTINDGLLAKTENYLVEIENNHHTLTHKHKSKLYAYLSAKNEYVGAKLGEAARFGAWNWDSEAMAPYKKVLELA